MTTILEDTQRLVDGARLQDYGDPKECFTMIAGMWGSYLKTNVTPHDVAQMMIMLKIARGRRGYARANVEDIVGYAYCDDLISRPQELVSATG